MITLCPICDGVMTRVKDAFVCDKCCFEMSIGSPNFNESPERSAGVHRGSETRNER